MIDISRHIEYLLLYSDEVAVQQLGVFRAEHKPSRWVQDEQIFLPPYRTVTFQQQEVVDDTHLLHTLALKYHTSLQEADIQRTEFVERLKQELQDNGSADLGNIGVFVRDEAQGELLFIPGQSGVTTPALYGLDALHMEPLPVAAQTSGRVSRPVATHTAHDEDYFVIRIPKRVVHYTSAVAAAAILFFAMSTPISERTTSATQTAHTPLFLPAHLVEAPVATPAEQASVVETETVAEENVACVETPVVTEKEALAPEETAAEQPVVASSQGRYALVLASAIPMERAEQYAQQLQKRGLQAEARRMGKTVRVIIPGFDTSEAVQDKIRELKATSSEYQSAWTLKMD